VDPADPQDPAELLSDLADRVPEVRHALVVSADGVALAASGPALSGSALSDSALSGDLERLAAITSSLISLAAGAAAVSGNGPVTQAVVVMEHGTFVIMAVDEGASLAVLTTADADLDQVAYEMTMLVERSATALTAPARRDPAPRSQCDEP
jgi:uncharacterized protein